MSTPATGTPSPTTPAQAAPASAPSPAEGVKPAAAAPAAPAAPPEAQKVPTPAEIRRLKVKLDGADVELPEEEVIRLASLSGAAQKRFQEAAAEKKKVTEVLELLKNKPKEALARLGVNLKQFSEETLTEILKQEAETPEAKRAREAEDKLREYERKDKEAQTTAAEQKIEAEKQAKIQETIQKEQALIKRFDGVFTEALSKAEVPKTPASVARMAQLQRVCIKKGYELDAAALAKIVKEDYDAEIHGQITGYKTADGQLDGAKIMAFLGEDGINAIKRELIAKLKGAKPAFSKPAEPTTIPATSQNGSWKQFRNKNREVFRKT